MVAQHLRCKTILFAWCFENITGDIFVRYHNYVKANDIELPKNVLLKYSRDISIIFSHRFDKIFFSNSILLAAQ